MQVGRLGCRRTNRMRCLRIYLLLSRRRWILRSPQIALPSFDGELIIIVGFAPANQHPGRPLWPEGAFSRSCGEDPSSFLLPLLPLQKATRCPQRLRVARRFACIYMLICSGGQSPRPVRPPPLPGSSFSSLLFPRTMRLPFAKNPDTSTKRIKPRPAGSGGGFQISYFRPSQPRSMASGQRRGGQRRARTGVQIKQ